MKFIFRGDLSSTNGYSRAIRAYANLCRNFGDIEGIPIHNGIDATDYWRHSVSDETSLFLKSANTAGEKTVVIQVCTPNLYVRYPNAINVGCFFWESRTLPMSFDWMAGFASIDWLWLPASFMQEMPVVNQIVKKFVLPWPVMFSDDGAATSIVVNIGNLIAIKADGSTESSSLDVIRRKFSHIYLSVSSIAARKGVPGLIRSWLASNVKGALVLRLSLKHFSIPVVSIQDYLEKVGLNGADLSRVYFLLDELPDTHLRELYMKSDFYVTNTHGEGYGGPIAEAILFGLPVISPVHTGIEDLLSVAHPLRVGHTFAQVSLLGNISEYSHSTEWCVPDVQALTKGFQLADAMTHAEKTTISKSQLSQYAKLNNKKYLLDTLGAWLGAL